MKPSCILVVSLIFAIAGCEKTEVTELKMDAKPGPDELWINRFLGLEIYRIDIAKWNLYRDKEDGRMNFWIYLKSRTPIKQFEDTEYTIMQPSWELNLVEPSVEIAEGFVASIPTSYDEQRGGWITNFYSGSHGGSEENTIKVLQRDGDRLLIRLTGEIVDPNFYDDSKPRSQLLVETWFTLDPEGSRSMQ